MRISDCSSDVCSSDLTEPNPQDGRSNAALARIVYDPANGHKLRLTGEYLDTHLYTNGLTGLSASVERLEGFDSGERKRVSLDWSWEGQGAIDFARVALYCQDGAAKQDTGENHTPAARPTPPPPPETNTKQNRAETPGE